MGEPRPLWRLSKELQSALVQRQETHTAGNGGSSSSGSLSPIADSPGFRDVAARGAVHRDASDDPEAASRVHWGRLDLPGQMMSRTTGAEEMPPDRGRFFPARAQVPKAKEARSGNGGKFQTSAGNDSSYRWALFSGSAPSTCSTMASSNGSQKAVPHREPPDVASGGSGTPWNSSRQSEGQRPFTLGSCLQPFRGFDDALAARPAEERMPRLAGLGDACLDLACLDEDYFHTQRSRSSEGSTDSCRSYDVVARAA